MQCTGEEQKTQHAVHQCLVEVDLQNEALDGLLEPREPELREDDETHRHRQRYEHQPDGRRQLDVSVVDVAENRGNSDQNGRYVEYAHIH